MWAASTTPLVFRHALNPLLICTYAFCSPATSRDTTCQQLRRSQLIAAAACICLSFHAAISPTLLAVRSHACLHCRAPPLAVLYRVCNSTPPSSRVQRMRSCCGGRSPSALSAPPCPKPPMRHAPVSQFGRAVDSPMCCAGTFQDFKQAWVLQSLHQHALALHELVSS